MVRIMIKGGVWKNTEDEILKAAVMKYGKNAWSRVASLLNRKSAKQCKARWYEWLDPSIRKVEWSREEEEKLLHLAKLYPAQWRTIAPIVGRTAAQCMEHYEHLLDTAQAAAAAEATGGEDAAGGGLGSAAAEARKLRPGEIDPHPETKPARPDPIDMDEDEKEMLAEARARLANTRGKKAKRKAREKQLEEAKRLANMQKRRELKAAGVLSATGNARRRNKRKNEVDYHTEIPFQRHAPAGFYAVDGEQERSRQLSVEANGRDFEVQRLDKLEAKRRDKEEAEEAKRDRKKLRKMEQANPAQLMAQVAAANDPSTYRRRSELSLPAPQVSDAELEAVVKVGATALVSSEYASSVRLAGGDTPATSALLGDVDQQRSVLPTPLRTPREGGGAENGGRRGDMVLQEARNQLLAMNSQTPLLGGENPAFDLNDGTGFGGATPRAGKDRLATPNVLAGGGGGATPLIGYGMGGPWQPVGAGVGSQLPTPLRDELGVNSGEAMLEDASDTDSLMSGESGASVGGQRLTSKKLQKHQQAQIAASLENLPEPQYTYDIEVPDVQPPPAFDDDAEEDMRRRGTMQDAEDAADVDARKAAARKAEEEAELARRSAAVRYGLPRPMDFANIEQLYASASSSSSSSSEEALEAASKLVRAEMALLLAHDATMHPFLKVGRAGGKMDKKKQKQESKKRGRDGASLQSRMDGKLLEVTDEEMAAARSLVATELAADAEANALQSAMIAESEARRAPEAAAAATAIAAGDPSGNDHLWRDGGFFGTLAVEARNEFAYLPERENYGLISTASAKERISSLKHEYESLREQLSKYAERCAKMEKKLEVKTKGYADVANRLRQETTAAYDQIIYETTQLSAFQMLAANEAIALPQRINELYDLSKVAKERNAVLQAKYMKLLSERDHLYALVATRTSDEAKDMAISDSTQSSS